MDGLAERAARELHQVVDQYAAGEAEVVRAYFERPHTPEENVDVVLRQAGREIQTADGLHRALRMEEWLEISVDRHVFAGVLAQIAEETEHYVLLADLAEWVAGRRLSAEELRRYEVHAIAEPDVPLDKDVNPFLPEANRMVQVGRDLMASMGYERGRELIRLTEGGGGGAFTECARQQGDPFRDRLADTMRRILKDELRHGPEHIDEYARTRVSNDAQLPEDIRWLKGFMAQHLRVRNEIWNNPLSSERLAAIDRGEVAPFDPFIEL